MEAFEPAIHYGPNDAGISAINIIAIIIAIIIVPLAFNFIYSQVSKILEKDKSK